MKQSSRKYYYVYITASISGVIYVGFTDCLVTRIKQHKKGTYQNSFSKKYKTNRLVYWEHYYSMDEAFKRERQMKTWRREKKMALIKKENPEWNDLYQLVIEMSKIRSLF
ncbi:MAG: GIY-YIG nuclease family protein [Candidatus Magasanikbacteria bacterium]